MFALQHRLPISALATALALVWPAAALAIDVKLAGRVMFGAAFRTEEPDPALLVSYNAAAIGLQGFANSGQNTDDANLNFRRGDATTRALRGYLDLSLVHGPYSALVRAKGWHDFALEGHRRPWGNNPNNYAADQPLSDRGAARLSRFSGVALGDAYLQYQAPPGRHVVLVRVGQQTLNWGEQAAFGGGLSAINSADLPALRRAGAAPQELRVPSPMAFVRHGIGPGLAIEGFYGTAFRPSALDMCGTFWTSTDYLAQGCDRAFAGSLALSDRQRLAAGAFLKRTDSPSANEGAQYGTALAWQRGAFNVGLYAARYTNRTPIPGLRKSTREGVPFLAGDPDGRNPVFFTEHVDGIGLYAANASWKRGPDAFSGELAYRPDQPLQLPPGDVLPAFLNPLAPSLLRADATATAPGAVFHGHDRLRTVQLQLGWQHTFARRGAVIWSGSFDIVGKRVMALPDPALRRYGRPDQFGTGPIHGVCVPNSRYVERQCSYDGYVSPNAFGYRLRADARMNGARAGLNLHASALFTHDTKGWAHDFLLSEGRRSLQLAVRAEFRKRYLAELVYSPIWGGRYSNQSDKDQLSMAAGLMF